MAPRVVKGKCAYQNDWESEFTWVRPDTSSKYSAKCTLCSTTILVDTMGRSALASHAKGEKHKKRAIAKMKSGPLDIWAKPVPSKTSVEIASISTSTSTQLVDDSKPTIRSALPGMSSSNTLRNRIDKYLLQEQVAKAETIWALQTVTNHTSLRTAGNCTKLFPYMFPDSEIASKMMLQKDKLSYIILYGLCPYFKGTLEAIIADSKFVVLGFDESHNKIAQKQQMDLSIRFWNEEENQVNSRYFTSAFLHKTSAEDLLKAIEENVSENILNKVYQLSMDGPNVNFKVQRMLLECRRSEPGAYQLLNIGSCGLHTLHNAFKVGMAKTTWDLMVFFRAIFNLFKYSPGRRGEFIKVTDSSVFPLEVCPVRWVENGPVARRALELLPNIEKYVNVMKTNGTEPPCNSFTIVSKFLKDKLLVAKIAFFEGLSNEIVPFLTEFQTDSPMSPFLYSTLSVLVECTMKRIVKDDVLEGLNSDIHKVDVLKKNDDSKFYEYLKSGKDIDLGYGTRAALRKCVGVSQKDVLIFRQDCRTALQFFIAKMMEKSPLKYPLTKALTCFNPDYIAKGHTEENLTFTLEKILEANLLSSTQIEKADREYKQLCSCPIVTERCKAFSRSDIRLDDFWMQILKGKKMSNLEMVIKLVLTLSHGNANVERGFSINKEILVENLKEKSLIAQRIVYESVKVKGSIENVELSTKMLQFVRTSHARYKEALEEQRKLTNAKKTQAHEKRKVQAELKDLLNKKQKLLEEANKEIANIDDRVQELKGFRPS